MCPQKNRRLSPDNGPIVFPSPASMPKTDEPLVQPDDASDIILDPYGNLYCFVCKVSVPRGGSNVSQHLGGKKHDTNNKRFKTDAEKALFRTKVVSAAQQQRAQIPASPTEDANPKGAAKDATKLTKAKTSDSSAKSNKHNKPVSVDPPISSPDDSPPEPDAPAPAKAVEKKKKSGRVSDAKRLRSIQIDKASFLTTLLAAESDTGSSNDHEESKSDALENPEERQKPFGPLSFKAPDGPDYFFESMAEETEPSKDAAKLREILGTASNRKKKRVDNSRTDMEPGETVSDDDALPDDNFLSLSNKKSRQDEKKQMVAAEEEMRQARNSIIILRDVNGEELPPWLISPEGTDNVLYSSDSSIALHYEILEFSRFVSPTQAELASRSEMVLMVESIVKQLWPSSTVQVFGSYATELYLPSSDIDICVTDTPLDGTLEEFTQLAEAIRNVSGFARRVNVIKAKVSLVKIIGRKDGMNCDISIGVENGPRNVPVIKQFVKDYPAMRPLLLVIKCFLQQRDLNEVFSGGLGSYTILLLVVSHLQMLRYNFPTSKANLGAVLQQFFQFYGRTFNICTTGIRVKDKGSYFDKFEKYQTTPSDIIRYCVEDPNDETNELGRNGYGALRVRKAFYNASMTLMNWRRDDSTGSPTPLGSIVRSDDLLLMRRSSVLSDCERKGNRTVRRSLKAEKWKPVGATLNIAEGNGFDKTSRRQNKHGKGEYSERIRDPRLVKRRRSDARGDGDQSAMGVDGGYNGRTVVNGTYNVAQNQGNYDPIMFYGQGQATYTGQGYPASTPGYEYPVGMAGAMYANAYSQQQIGGQGTQGPGNYNYGSEGEQRRRRPKRRFQRRGGSRGR